jgi:protease PrsW
MLASTIQFDTAALTLGVGVLYLLLVRFLDLNEKEPLWAVAMLFLLGAGAAVVLPLLVSSQVLALTVLPAAAATEGARFVAIAGGMGVLTLIGQRRGWSEIDGVMDGLVYGACGGLGFATGHILMRDISFGASVGIEASLLPTLGRAALGGLADGVFGALIGAGLAAALHSKQPAARAVLPIGGFAAAVACHAAHLELSQGNSLSGTQGMIRAWVGLLLPVVLVIAMGVIALGAEKRAIREQLGSEAEGGVVTADDFALLTNLLRRQAVYLKALVTAQIGALMRMRAMHNRQVQLALAKKRASSDAEAAAEVDKLRAAVLDLKRTLQRPS